MIAKGAFYDLCVLFFSCLFLMLFFFFSHFLHLILSFFFPLLFIFD